MVDGGVSIAVRSVYPGKQVRILSYEVLREAGKTAGKVVRRAQSFVAMSSSRIIDNRANDLNPLRATCMSSKTSSGGSCSSTSTKIRNVSACWSRVRESRQM
jgi:hypothetical protein